MKKALKVFLIFLGIQAISGIVLQVLGLQENALAAGRGMFAASLAIVALLWLCRLAGRESAWQPCSSWKSREVGVALLAIGGVSFGMSLLTEPLSLNDLGLEDMFNAMRSDPLCILALCVVGPLTEEVVFRDGILRHLVAGGMKPWVAVAVGAALFGVIHIDPAQMVPAIVGGIALGALFIRTGNLSLCLPAHIFNNSLAIGLMYVPGSADWTKSWSLTAHIAAGLPLLIAGFGLVWWLTSKPCRKEC